MATTISLVNICHHSYKIFFPVMRTLKIYSLSNFQICHAVLLTIVSMTFIEIFFFKKFLLLFNYSCLYFPSTPPQPNPPPSSASTLPLDFVHVSFIVAPVIPSPHCHLPTPLWLLRSS